VPFFRESNVKRVILMTLLLTFPQLACAQEESIVLPVPEALGTISAGYFDDAYLSEEGVQHLGVDIPAPDRSVVVAPVSGTVILNRTNVADPFNAYLIIRSSATGFEHVLAHLKSDIEVPFDVNAGDPVGTIVKAGSGPHLHYGLNQLSVSGAIDVSTGWGFGRGPASASPLDAGQRGWLAPNEIELERLLKAVGSESKGTGWWSPGLVLLGAAEQNNGSAWSIRIEIQSAKDARIFYDSIPCAGRLQVTSKLDSKIWAQEKITENRSRCIDGGIVEIEQIDANEFNYSWQKGGSIASGSLRAQSAASATQASENAAIEKDIALDRPSGRQRIDVASGQGLAGFADLEFFVGETGEVLVRVTKMQLNYAPQAGFNNIDDKYKGLQVAGFLSVLRADNRKEPIFRKLAPIAGALDQSGAFQCTDCTSFVFPVKELRQSDVFLSAFVVGEIIFFGNLEIPTRLIAP
jgi:hypothetical protein